MPKGIFITGTDTGIGKTFVTAGLALILREKGIEAGVMKPVASGCIDRGGRMVSPDVLFLKEVTGLKDEAGLINPYALKAPLSPSVAARMEGVQVDIERIKECFDTLSQRHEILLVEGVGGFMTPISDTQMVVDLVKVLNLPLLVVVGVRLGAINHTLLAISKAESAGIEVKGVVINEFLPDSGLAGKTIRSEIERFTEVPILGEIPHCEDKNLLSGTFKKSIDLKRLFGISLQG